MFTPEEISSAKNLFSLRDTKEKNVREVVFHTGRVCGEVAVRDDGYYAYWSKSKYGFWEWPILLGLAALLKELNIEWDKKVQEGL